MEGRRETNENGKPVVRVPNNDPYAWVKGEGERVKVEFLPCSVEDRVFHKAEGHEPQLEVFFSFFQAKGIRKGRLLTLNSCQGRTLFPLYKSSYKDFKQMYVKVRSPVDEFPFYVDEYLLERFSLYWYSKLVQILGMNEVNEENTTTRVLKNFFKTKNERELSASNVIKTETGVVVNQPTEKRKPISVKRRRQEEGVLEKGKVVDLTGNRCCGKEFSLEEVKFTENQKRLHGYVGEEDLTSVWSEHYPLLVVAEEHFQ
ncbi:hypothetical protein PIB30_086880 [Stylosanthes scabra]|uniref:Transposase n=1 Tax=Stylosanthes scabra TaxID=79078 RepID=A0ABU6QTT1_9FABA|nr:hypothetical protein [Stylosanthes scabra]